MVVFALVYLSVLPEALDEILFMGKLIPISKEGVGVVKLDQQTGVPHTICWSKSSTAL